MITAFQLASLLYLPVKALRPMLFQTAANLLTSLGDNTQVPVLCHAEEATVKWVLKGSDHDALS